MVVILRGVGLALCRTIDHAVDGAGYLRDDRVYVGAGHGRGHGPGSCALRRKVILADLERGVLRDREGPRGV